MQLHSVYESRRTLLSIVCVFVCKCVCVTVYFTLAGSSTLRFSPPRPFLSVSCLTSLLLLRLETLSFDTFESNGQTLLVFLYCALHHVLAHSLSSSSRPISLSSRSMITHTPAGHHVVQVSFRLFSCIWQLIPSRKKSVNKVRIACD